jgi:hypothetical protein
MQQYEALTPQADDIVAAFAAGRTPGGTAIQGVYLDEEGNKVGPGGFYILARYIGNDDPTFLIGQI